MYKYYSIDDAKNAGLIQLTEWLRDNVDEHSIACRFIDSVLDDILCERKAIIVQNAGLISVWVNDVAKR